MNSLIHSVSKLIQSGLDEDLAQWDFTTQAAIQAKMHFAQHSKKNVKLAPARAHITAKSDCVWAGNFILEALTTLSEDLFVESNIADGEYVKSKTRVCTWEGRPEEILIFERTFLNLAAYTSGIATRTRKLVQAAEKGAKKNKVKDIPRVTATRKSLPHYRDLAIQGVVLGGGFSHRLNLAGGVLIKENHIAVAGGISQAVIAAGGTAPHTLRIEVEVKNLDELREAISIGADGVMLDNFSVSEVKKALKLCEGVFVEISGGIREDNIGDYVLPGVHLISSGGITQYPHPVDLSLLIE